MKNIYETVKAFFDGNKKIICPRCCETRHERDRKGPFVNAYAFEYATDARCDECGCEIVQ